jgi:hypothetical protein
MKVIWHLPKISSRMLRICESPDPSCEATPDFGLVISEARSNLA